MTEEQFCTFVEGAIEKNPEWVVGIMQAARIGLLKRQQSDSQRSCDMETIALTLADRYATKLSKKDKDLILSKLESWKEKTSFVWDSTLKKIGVEKKEIDD